MSAQQSAAVSPWLRAPFNVWPPEKLLAYFRQRKSVQYFPVVDETQISRAKTEQALGNRFDFNEEPYQLEAGFDWTVNPSADLEWLILLHKFYYAAGLGVAYDETKDERYARKWIELTGSWIASTPLDFLPTDVAGRRMQNWLSAHYYFVTRNQAASLTPSFYARFLHSLHRQAAHLQANLTPARNHRTLELWALFAVAVVFPEFKDAAQWLALAKEELLLNAQTDLLPDGVHCELSTDYHHLALRNFLHVIRLAQLNHIELSAAFHARVRKALEFALYIHKPDGLIPALSDGDASCYLPLLAQGRELYGDEAMLYAATLGRQGHPPAQRSRGFDESGYYILRSGWGAGGEAYADERYLVFDCGPLGAGNHGHFDLLSIELAAYGQSLVVDPGRYTYHEPSNAEAEETNWRVRFRGAGAHNTVLVDGRNQTRYEFHKRKFKIKGPPPEHELKAFVTREGFDYLHGVARSSEYDATHERKIVFPNGEYWLVVDRLTAEDAHDYELLFHLSAVALGQTAMTANCETLLVDAPHLVIAQACETETTPSINPGFVSPSYGVKHPAPVVSFARRASDACFHTILHPYKTERPVITMEKLPVQSEGRLCAETEASALRVTITTTEQRRQDFFLLVHRESGETVSCGSIKFNGKLLHLRTDRQGRLLQRNIVV